jgi:methionyl-tRNA synthetase
MKKNFYITTTLPYVNAEPHIGFALEIIQADVLARYHRLKGEDVFFNTGTDEHGLKIYRRALEEGKEPQKYVDEYAQKFDNLKRALNLSYDNFIRTTDGHHIEAAKEFWKRCQKSGDIYKAKQKIKYCVGCELEKTKSELVDNRCPIHPREKLETIEEENYFFRFSRYQEPLLAFYKNNPNFVVPQGRFKEIKNFVAKGLKDFSISRLKKKLPWGIEVPGDSDHIMYVWFDALINYISAIGWPHNMAKFNQWWPGMQTAGKDNLRQQSAMWQKMSKSLGNVVDPFEVVSKYGTDAARYYLLKEIPPTKDGDFSTQRFEEIYNADLANGLGNLVARIIRMISLFFEGKVPNVDIKKTGGNIIKESGEKTAFVSVGHPRGITFQTWDTVPFFLNDFAFDKALWRIWYVIRFANGYIDAYKPWVLAKKGRGEKLAIVIYDLVETLRHIAWLLTPFLPETANNIAEQLGIGPLVDKQGTPLGVKYLKFINGKTKKPISDIPGKIKDWGQLKPGTKIKTGNPLFPRI